MVIFTLQLCNVMHLSPKIFLYLISQYGWHHPIHENVTESAAKLERKCATWWLPSTLWAQDVCNAHRCPSLSCASDSIRDRHLRGEQLCKIVSFSKSGSGFNYSTEKRVDIELIIVFPDNSNVAQMHNSICFPKHVFLNSDLIILKHWHSCEIFIRKCHLSPQ